MTMQAKRRAIHVAYSVSFKHGRIYHAAAYTEESGFPGLPDSQVYRSGYSVANDTDSALTARRWAVSRLLRDYPEFSDCQVFDFGRLPSELISAAPVFAYRGRNHFAGVALEYTEESAN